MDRRELTRLFAIPMLLAAPLAQAAGDACVLPDSVAPGADVLAARTSPLTAAEVRADDAVYEGAAGRYRFLGDVEFEFADQHLQAERAYYTEPTGLVEAEGDLRYRETGLSLSAREGFLDLDASRGRFLDLEFTLDPGTARGAADAAVVLERGRVRLDQVRYTLCPPGDEDWWLRGDEVVLDRDAGVGTARNAWLEFLGVPLFYTPYISFPLGDERKSGFLAPELGYSSESGFDVELPYYLNLAPSYDATLYPRVLFERGFLLGVEARWLNEDFYTTGYIEYVPEDRLAGEQNPAVDSTRWLASGQIEDRSAGPFGYRAVFNRVSDDEYLDDFESGLISTSTSHLPSYAQAFYHEENWSLTAQTRAWQTLDPAIGPLDLPYRLLPRVEFNYSSNPVGNGWVGLMDAELTHFEHPRPELNTTGVRAQVTPQLAYRYEQLGYFVTPAVALRHTAYQVERADVEVGAPESPSRTLPIFSIDSGVFVERELQLFDRQLTQTLEPRLLYLYIPERDQTDLPAFDTEQSLADLSLARLFTINRYAGPDRIGDADQFALAVTSRFLDRESGREYLRASLGQVYYLDEPEVTFAPTPTAEEALLRERSVSDILAALRADFGRVLLDLDAEWDPYQARTERAGALLAFRPDPVTRLNLGYRISRRTPPERLEQTELSLVLPLKDNLIGVAGWHYSLQDDLTLERFVGLAYRNCCWSARVVAREWLDDVVAADDYNRAILLQLELIGLGAIGQPVEEFLLETISGYNANRF